MLSRINLGMAVVMTGVVFVAVVVERERKGQLPEPTGEQAPTGLARFYDQRVDWESCRGGLCGTIRVPLDYEEPGGRTVDLRVKYRPADDKPTRRLLFVNPGGPGGSAFEYASGFAGGSRALRMELGIVGVDPRGVGTSEALDCFTRSQLDGLLDVDSSPDERSEINDLRFAFENLGESCVKNSGDLVGHMSTEEAVRDLDVVRAVLGQDELDYYGASYGTQIGATYAHLFPEHAGRMVLDAGVDPSLSPRRHARQQAEGFEKSLRRFLSYCTKLDSCPLGEDVDQAQDRVVDVLEEADDKPLPSTGVRPATEAAAVRGIAFALYERDRWPALVLTMSRATFGDGTALRRLADKYDQRDDTDYANNSTVAYFAVRCLDYPKAPGYTKVADFESDFSDAAPVFGRSLAWSAAECSSWPVASSSPQKSVSADAVDSIVVVGTTHDPATPYKWSESLVRQLGSARLLTREGDGHTAYHTGNRCIDELVDDHLLGRSLPRGDLRCDEDGRLVR
ncbi:MAG: alpha/beta hydrolase [Aeromicrobium sp.]